MKITLAETKKILDTLPIGYYTKRNIPCELDGNEETSYYVPVEDRIVISYPIIETALSNAEMDKETAIRSMLYHEVSHAVLTPKKLMRDYGYTQERADVLNIFEDERIETILKDYYLDVDFENQKYAINGIDKNNVPSPENTMNAFYTLVRYRKGKKNYVERVEKIINKWSRVNANSECCYSYVKDVLDLYHDLQDDVEKNPNDYDINGNENDNENGNENGNEDNFSNIGDKIGKEGNASCSLSNNNDTYTDEKMEKRGETMGRGELNDLFESVINKTYDTKVIDTINQIFMNFNSRSKANNSTTQGYSGIFNPRNLANNNYKYFDRKCQKGSTKGFSKFHLNLFIDCSGSYDSNVDKTNQLLQALRYIEKTNDMFTFDLIECGDGQQKLPNDRKINRAYSGTYLTADIFDLFRKQQQSQSVVYNIVLYDGQATSRENDKNFSAFNTTNTTLIYERDNKKAIEKYCPKAKKIFVENHFADNLIENVINTLRVALN